MFSFIVPVADVIITSGFEGRIGMLQPQTEI